MSKYTEYAHEYLSGSSLVPVGVLDHPEFKAEVRRLWGPEPTAKETATHRRHVERSIAQVEAVVKSKLGPKGGRPRTREFKYLESQLEMLRRSL